MLHGDLQRMGHIEKVTGSIKEAKEKVEAEKKKGNGAWEKAKRAEK